MKKIDLVGQQFGTRIVINNDCTDSDWLKQGFKIPITKDKYRQTKCLNCGAILPADVRLLKRQPPKRCVFCSNIGNHSNVTPITNTWALYDTYAVCNVLYGKEVVSFEIDVSAYTLVSSYTWRISKKRQKYYVVSGSAKKGTLMYVHQLILGPTPAGMEIDHIDGNSLNNRKANLRFVSHQENVDNIKATRIDNQIGIRGIVYEKKSRKYKVDFYYHGHRYYLKDWDTLEEAAWCRYYLEQYFNIHMIEANPIFAQFQDTNNSIRQSIEAYVLHIINTQK